MTTATKRKKKAGRPAKNVKKEIRACIRFTKVEYFIVQDKAEKAALTAAAYIRESAIHALVKARLTDEERQLLRHLIGMSNNLNQIAKACHQEGALQALVYFEQFRDRIDQIIKKLKS